METQPNTIAETSTTAVEAGPIEQPTPAIQERMFNKAQVQDLMRKRVNRSHDAFFNRYGVKDLAGLDGLFEKAKKYSDMESQFGAIQLKNSELLRENAFLRNNINPDKYNDIVAHFKGTGTDFSEEALLQQLQAHPEWLKPSNIPATTTITTLGSEAHASAQPNELELAGKLLGVKF